MAGETSRENGRKGGRPKGSKSAATLERESIAAAFKQRVMRSADVLFEAQLSLAQGCSFLYRVERKKGEKDKHVLVTDPDEIKAYLDGEAEGDYHYITTKEPNNQAIANMLDRGIGKPVEELEVSGKEGGPLAVVFGGRFKPHAA